MAAVNCGRFQPAKGSTNYSGRRSPHVSNVGEEQQQVDRYTFWVSHGIGIYEVGVDSDR